MPNKSIPENKSASRVVEILDFIASERRAVTISEISSALKIPKSSVFNLLHTLAAKRYLEIEDQNLKTFGLGFKLFQTGVSYLQNTRLHQIAHPILKSLMEESGETVFLAVEDEGKLVFLDSVETSTSIRTTARLGRSTKPMYCSGLGKALLAAYPPDRVREIVQKDGFVPVTENTVKNLEELLQELDRTRKRGYSIDAREGDPNLICVAAPIYDQSNTAVAAISIATPYFKIDNRRRSQFGKLITETALNISGKLGFLEEKTYPDGKPDQHL
jgi:DNA-binding IclR family transcriptional regulator